METAHRVRDLMACTETLASAMSRFPASRRFPPATLEAVHSMAYHLLRQGRHVRAMQYFGFLAMYAPTDVRFVSGLATTHQRCGNHAQALHLFSLAAYLQPQRPAFVLRMAECFLRLEGYVAARTLLDLVVRHCSESGGHHAIRLRAQVLLDVFAHGRHAA